MTSILRRPARVLRPGGSLILVIGVAVVIAVSAGFMLTRGHHPATMSLPVHARGQIALPGDSSRFDYASLDPDRGLLFIAHLGASQVIEVDVRRGTVVRTIDGVDRVHGVLVVARHQQVYATATGANQMVILDENTGQRVGEAPTGDYPDGLAYDPVRDTIWTTNESGGSETVIDPGSHRVVGTVELGGEAGNVAYDPVGATMLVAVQTRNELAVIDPATLAITRRVALRGCDHDHGLALDPAHRLAFIACDNNAALLTVDLDTWQVLAADQVGDDPDVLAFDAGAGRLYVAAESGWLTILDERDRRLSVAGRDYLAGNAHVVAVDPTTHRSYYPVPHGPDGRPALLYLDPNGDRADPSATPMAMIAYVTSRRRYVRLARRGKPSGTAPPNRRAWPTRHGRATCSARR
jgi:DNA-binding beta-propeller fold protein YncE